MEEHLRDTEKRLDWSLGETAKFSSIFIFSSPTELEPQIFSWICDSECKNISKLPLQLEIQVCKFLPMGYKQKRHIQVQVCPQREHRWHLPPVCPSCCMDGIWGHAMSHLEPYGQEPLCRNATLQQDWGILTLGTGIRAQDYLHLGCYWGVEGGESVYFSNSLLFGVFVTTSCPYILNSTRNAFYKECIKNYMSHN